MDIYSIYKATNIVNGKSYIGYTNDFHQRKIDHLSSSKVNKSNNRFHNAIRKHGWDNFQWDIIYQSTDKEYCHQIMERYFIKEYNTYNTGYNMTEGGEGGDTSKSPNYIKWIKERNYSGVNSPTYGKKRPDVSLRMKMNNPMHKKVNTNILHYG